jgi:hypothetical protein
MKIGFTGTRNGMNDIQRYNFNKLIVKLTSENLITAFHHGDCVGSDDDAHGLIESFNDALTDKADFITLCIHPPLDDSLQAKNEGPGTIMYCEPKTYLARNRDIVNVSDIMIACPPTNTEMKRGGTWYTINYAKKQGKSLYILYPDGRIEHVN